jgi:hypothetical protein
MFTAEHAETVEAKRTGTNYQRTVLSLRGFEIAIKGD